MRELIDFFRIAAPYYDADYAAINYTADIGFYVDLARESGGPVLEMGCGTGRVLPPTARAGVRIQGVELSPDMLAVLRDKLAAEAAEVRERVTLTEGDICAVELGARFPLITAPFRVAQALVKREDQRAWLRNVRRHLAPGGALCFDVFQPNYAHTETSGPNVDVDRPDPATGGRIRRFARTIPHNEEQKLEVHLLWAHEDADGNRLSESSGRVELRWFTRGELENLLELEGFRIIDYWGSFARDPFGPGSGDQIIRAVAGG